MKTIARYRKLILFLLLPIGMLLMYASSNVPHIVEGVYSTSFYRFLGQIISNVTGILPFSVGELAVVCFVFFIIYYLTRTILILLKPTANRKKTVTGFISNIFAAAGVIYFSFVLVWGLNYSRQPFSVIGRLEVRPASVNELAEMCEELIKTTNQLRTRIREDQAGVMILADSKHESLKRAFKGFEYASAAYPELGGSFGRPKPVFLSELMCYTGITGIYFPFTAEANVNMSNTASMLPATTCHEMAHQRGFAREDEANFIAYLTCKVHPDADYQYSGHLLALIHSMNALRSYDADRARSLGTKYSEGVRRDLRDIDLFWQKYEGPVEKISTSINNAYLKANMQNDGVYSYDRMVDLLLAEYRTAVSQ